jgi:hypothetical protein
MLGGNGIQACVCPPGNRAVRVLLNSYNNSVAGLVCEPCPKGYFSRTVGASCTPCGKYMTTANVGSKSLRDCVVA